MKIQEVKAFQDARFLRHLCEILHHLEFYDLERNFCRRNGLDGGAYAMTRQEVEEYEYQMREWYHQIEKDAKREDKICKEKTTIPTIQEVREGDDGC